MRLTMQVFLDELKEYVLEECVREESSDLLISPRIFFRQMLEAIAPEHVYVGMEEEFYGFRKNRNFSAVIYIGNRSIEEMDFYEGIDVIRVSGDITQIFIRVQQIFEKYNRWDERLLDAVMEHMKLQKLVEIGAEMFPNPLAVFDSSLYCLAIGGKLPDENTRNPIWSSVIHKNHPLTVSSRMGAYKKAGKQYGTREETVLIKKVEVEGIQPYDMLMSYMYYNGTRLANIGMTEIWEPITQGQAFLCGHLAKRIKNWLLDSPDVTSEEPVKQVIRNLLQGYPVPKGLIERSVNWMNKKRNHKVYLIYFDLEYAAERPGITTESAVKHVKKTVEKIKAFNEIVLEYEKKVLMVLCTDSEKDIFERIEIVKKNLETAIGNLVIGISEAYEEFENIRLAYLQAVAAVESGKRREDNKSRIYRFSDYAVEHLLFTYLQSQSAEMFCAKDIKLLCAFDRKNETEYVKTLKVYYQCDANMTQAAKLLNIHRNSMTYRMEKILEILNKESVSDICEGNKLYAEISCELIETDSVDVY